jgi:hypothetical protein
MFPTNNSSGYSCHIPPVQKPELVASGDAGRDVPANSAGADGSCRLAADAILCVREEMYFIINVININKLRFVKMTKKEELKIQIIRRQQLHTAHTNLKYFGFTGIRDSVPAPTILIYYGFVMDICKIIVP